MKPRTLSIFAASLLAAIALGAARVSAHSFPESENPSAGETLNASPARITIKYDAPIEKMFASIRVLDASGKDEAAGAPEVSADGLTLSVKVSALRPGDYTVTWGVVCIDTHHTNGSYNFTVTGSGS